MRTKEGKSVSYQVLPSPKNFINNLIFNLYQKITFYTVDIINKKLRDNVEPKFNKTLCIIDYCGYRQNPLNSFDEFNINYLNEKLLILYSEISLSQEKNVYKQEGLES